MAKFAESEILKMMKNLSLSREDAIQLLQDDEDDVSEELTPEQKKVVKKMIQGDRKKETTPRKRERKVDEKKVSLMNWFRAPISEFGGTILNEKPESEIEFELDGETYSVRLIKHRKKKAE